MRKPFPPLRLVAPHLTAQTPHDDGQAMPAAANGAHGQVTQDMLTQLLAFALSEVCLMLSTERFDRALAITGLFESFVPPRTQADVAAALDRLYQRADRLGMSNWLSQGIERVSMDTPAV